jgi:predicted Rossmann fold nucleotide-binding protein DprA/Smf involved in DNA uptake
MTSDDIAGAFVPHVVTITGSRCTEHREPTQYELLFSAYLRPFAGQDSTVYVGGALGIDTLALDWLAEHTSAALTVVVPCTLADQPEQARQSVLSATRHAQRVSLVELGAPRLGAEAYHTRNRWMVDRSDFVIGFPHGDDPRSGTWYTIHYGANQGKPRLIVPI